MFRQERRPALSRTRHRHCKAIQQQQSASIEQLRTIGTPT
jgi:hypothetical protein